MIKILVVEDEPKSRQALASRLRDILGETALIELAADGSEAVSKAAQVQPDLVFMDIEMPLKSGVEAAAVIKRQRPETHIVFLTAYDRFDYAVGALRSGGEEYLLKPVPEADLRETLQKFFNVAPEGTHKVSPFEAELDVWVRRHYTEDAALEDAAASMGMSPFYFSRQVKAATGKTFLEFVTDYRIQRAKQRLLSTELPISDIGRAVGYPDSNYFTKVFKRTVGCTPSAYRSSKT
ncbi:helix-turn-helix domain-containing protein [uncultured Oscillibacter sp.]|uniref:response regulator transcription factor n=1 Tax=uncultured Oscillibacter sp. TaxID=876091 RepID=UPI00261BC345|nr:helix-turn-helix domain-containing protein [uncultured Oscillibacter sp.]